MAGGISQFWDGKIDEAAIWNRVLSETERSQLYNNAAGFPFTEFGLTTNGPQGWQHRDYVYGGAQPHAVTRVQSSAEESLDDVYQYDANGNMTCRVEAGQTWLQRYNSENRLYRVEKVSGSCSAPGTIEISWTFFYDGDGNRIFEEIDDGESISERRFYGGGLFELRGASDEIRYYSIAGQRVAMRDADGLKYLLTDHLGSVSAVLDNQGELLEGSRQRYMPFGESRMDAGGTPTDFAFTGQRGYTADFGLVDYNARFYNSRIGRFAQPDTIIPGAANPQAFNRYAYVLNNPVNFVDPSGHAQICLDTFACQNVDRAEIIDTSPASTRTPKPVDKVRVNLGEEDLPCVYRVGMTPQLCGHFPSTNSPLPEIDTADISILPPSSTPVFPFELNSATGGGIRINGTLFWLIFSGDISIDIVWLSISKDLVINFIPSGGLGAGAGYDAGLSGVIIYGADSPDDIEGAGVSIQGAAAVGIGLQSSWGISESHTGIGETQAQYWTFGIAGGAEGSIGAYGGYALRLLNVGQSGIKGPWFLEP